MKAQGISKRAWSVPLKPGMILSNEPGFYLEGAYGIRIESLVAVQDAPTAPGFLQLETLTLAAIDRNLIDAKLLGEQGVAWLNSYHAPRLSGNLAVPKPRRAKLAANRHRRAVNRGKGRANQCSASAPHGNRRPNLDG
jgi:hypothetical protein